MTYRSAMAALIVFVINVPAAFLLLAIGQPLLAIWVITLGTIAIWAIALGFVSL